MSCVSCVRGTTEEATEEAEEAEEEEGAGSQRSKTKTPHKDVGKKEKIVKQKLSCDMQTLV